LAVDRLESLGGAPLAQHFALLDKRLWQCLAIIAQTKPEYLQAQAMGPAVKQATGTSHGRRWFIRPDVQEILLARLVELVRRWGLKQLGPLEFLHDLFQLGLYRDTLRQWVEDAQLSGPGDLYVKKRFRSYLRFRHEIVLAYTPLVWSVAAKRGYNEELRQDLGQIGILGLIHAAERYHNVGPVTFSTFARRWVLQAILMYLQRKHAVISVSHGVLEEASRLRRKTDLTDHDEERAARVKQISEMREVVLLEDFERSIPAETPAEEERSKAIDFGNLTLLQKKILILRHGLVDRVRCGKDELEPETCRQLGLTARTET